MSRLARIEAPHFVAGIVFNERSVVTEAAPVLKYMLGWRREAVRSYCARKRWTARFVRTST